MNVQNIVKNQKRENEGQRAWADAGMTASATAEASKIGAEVLKSGGNAMDALAAMQFALAVSEPFNTGLGASGFIVYYDAKKQETKVIHGHSKAPKNARKNIFVDENQDVIPFLERSTPGTAVAIPGILKAFDQAIKLYGRKTWGEVIEPAIRLSEEGIEVNDLWVTAIERFGNRLGEEARSFFFPDDVPLTKGERVVNEDLTNALKELQKNGADSFYGGSIGKAIAEEVQKFEGCLVLEDLIDYEAKIAKPLQATYKEFDVVVPSPPNGGGFALLYMLKLLEKLNIGQYNVRSWEKYYLIAETLRIMTADKLTFMTDPSFYDIPLEGLLHPDYLDERLRLYNFTFRNDKIAAGNPWKYDKDKKPSGLKAQAFEIGSETTHFVAVDEEGNIAMCTSSLEHNFGSGIMVPGYGFLLNNDMTDFDPSIGGINSVEANKYPVSMKTPTLVFKDRKPFLTLGSPGGPTIVASVLQTLIHVINYEMDLKDAIEEPRIFNGTGPLIWWEEGLPEEARQVLEKMNYQFDEIALPMGNVQAVLFDHQSNQLYGASDSSRPGIPVGVNKSELN
ncbi:gamma-glutamyltranspeptidase [Bacillus sp. FJAT-27231]|uniref:gamma-glutamyltransferase n=1 Tax=Bacillus sp. FJAT-27231 TaxID=1679168 RepID=UPI00067085EE|nr:gamma-glutamyltransferase [Bacillus sp. FJAT-27231]KMY53857.1 gamma-glutamyltranspeptidase [Bacillus sp. FJAT-27231]